MAIDETRIAWVGKSNGIYLEEYQGNYTVKGVRRYESKGETKVTYEWAFPQEWDKDSRAWKAGTKARPLGLYLGSETQAIETLNALLYQLTNRTESDEIPF